MNCQLCKLKTKVYYENTDFIIIPYNNALLALYREHQKEMPNGVVEIMKIAMEDVANDVYGENNWRYDYFTNKEHFNFYAKPL